MRVSGNKRVGMGSKVSGFWQEIDLEKKQVDSILAAREPEKHKQELGAAF